MKDATVGPLAGIKPVRFCDCDPVQRCNQRYPYIPYMPLSSYYIIYRKLWLGSCFSCGLCSSVGQSAPLESVPGHFAEGHLAERHFAERTVCRRTFCRTDNLTNGQFDERTFCRKDILPKGQFAENVTHFCTMYFSTIRL